MIAVDSSVLLDVLTDDPRFAEASSMCITQALSTGEASAVIPGTAAITAPPVIVQGVVVTGHQVLDGQRRWAASGVIRGYDAVSGRLVARCCVRHGRHASGVGAGRPRR